MVGMTTTDPEPDAVDETATQAPIVTTDESGDVEADDRIELVRTGLVRVFIGGDRYRLRRPFFGEFKTLRVALEDMVDEIGDAQSVAQRVSREIVAKVTSDVAGGVERSPADQEEYERQSRRESRVAARTLNDVAENLRLVWWTSMWTLLCQDGIPVEWPSWVVDVEIPNALLSHWRSSPLGRG